MVVTELYRHTGDGLPAWKLRTLGQGWADGIDGLARTYGVDVEQMSLDGWKQPPAFRTIVSAEFAARRRVDGLRE
ncbi:hypothetical protein ABZ357_18630 [Streptomyces sp. NPDC005917]|uniref:hypothetical protein n=1 Tax=unclassified Streptomyces TaxID=2593676 RepID=UPI0033E70303